jgi:hypothetical protein
MSTRQSVGGKWSICEALQGDVHGWALRGVEDGQRVLLFFAIEADAVEMQQLLRAGATVDAAFAQLHSRQDALTDRQASGSTMAWRISHQADEDEKP